MDQNKMGKKPCVESHFLFHEIFYKYEYIYEMKSHLFVNKN